MGNCDCFTDSMGKNWNRTPRRNWHQEPESHQESRHHSVYLCFCSKAALLFVCLFLCGQHSFQINTIFVYGKISNLLDVSIQIPNSQERMLFVQFRSGVHLGQSASDKRQTYINTNMAAQGLLLCSQERAASSDTLNDDSYMVYLPFFPPSLFVLPPFLAFQGN